MIGQRYLSFSLGSEEYALPLLIVKEVIAVPDITPIPFTSSHFLGVMNLRGQVISVIDLRTRLGIEPHNAAESSVIICDLSPLTLGFVADSINAVHFPSPDEIVGKPDAKGSHNTDYITGVIRHGEDIIMIIDIARALGVEVLYQSKRRKAAA